MLETVRNICRRWYDRMIVLMKQEKEWKEWKKQQHVREACQEAYYRDRG